MFLLEDTDVIILTDESSLQFQMFYKSLLELDAKGNAKQASMEKDPPNKNILENLEKLADIKEEISEIDEDLFYDYNYEEYDTVDDEIGIIGIGKECAYMVQEINRFLEKNIESNIEDEEQLPTFREQSTAEKEEAMPIEERLKADAEKLIVDEKIMDEAAPLKNERKEKVKKVKKGNFEKKSSFSIPNKIFLKMHQHTHQNKKVGKCKFCDYKSPYRNQLKEHERRHTGEKPEICSFCNRGFSARGTLEAHRRTHTGEKPFKCKFCDLSFSQRNGVNSHAKTYHKYMLGTEKLYVYQKPISIRK